MYQAIDGTKSSVAYKLTFAVSPRPGLPEDTFEVYWNGVIVDVIQTSGANIVKPEWSVRTYTVIGIGETSTITFLDVDPNDTLSGFIDNVSLVSLTPDVQPEPVPEPTPEPPPVEPTSTPAHLEPSPNPVTQNVSVDGGGCSTVSGEGDALGILILIPLIFLSRRMREISCE